MTDLKQAAATIRRGLKAKGWTSRDVSVRIDRFANGSAIRVAVRNPRVPISAVKAIAKPHERIDRCSITGEILSGGNRYLTVEYTSEAAAALAAPLLPLLATVADDPGSLVDLPGGWVAYKSREPGEYWRAYPKPAEDGSTDHDQRHVYCWGMEFCAKQIAVHVLEQGGAP